MFEIDDCVNETTKNENAKYKGKLGSTHKLLFKNKIIRTYEKDDDFEKVSKDKCAGIGGRRRRRKTRRKRV
jgi:hypothetical protein